MPDATPGPDTTSWAGPDWPGVRAFCSERAGGVSVGPYASLNLGAHVGDQPAHVATNRARLRACLPDEPVWLEQVHGIDVHDADAVTAGATPPRADAAVTATRGRVLAIMTADCLPVVIGDQAGSVLGVAHAGWRGLAAGVLGTTLQRLRSMAPGAQEWRAWIGPAIGPAAFEVGGDVREAFLRGVDDADRYFVPRPALPGKFLADLPALAAAMLARDGVADVVLSGRCTVAEPDRYFSYRRDGVTGRIATLAWLD